MCAPGRDGIGVYMKLTDFQFWQFSTALFCLIPLSDGLTAMNKNEVWANISSSMGLVMAIWAKPRRKRVANYVLSKRVKTVFWRIIALNVLRWAQKVANRVD